MENFKKELQHINQAQLTDFMEELSSGQRVSFLKQIKNLNFQKIKKWVEKYVKNEESTKIPDHFDPAPGTARAPQRTDNFVQLVAGVNRRLSHLGRIEGRNSVFMIGHDREEVVVQMKERRP